MNDSKKSALQKIREAREGGVKRTDQYEVSQSVSAEVGHHTTVGAAPLYQKSSCFNDALLFLIIDSRTSRRI